MEDRGVASRAVAHVLRQAADSPAVHLAAGVVALVASAADVLDVALVGIVGFQLGSEVAILSIATLHVLKGIVDVCERSERIKATRRAQFAKA